MERILPDGMVLYFNQTPKLKNLPRRGTKLSRCLMVLYALGRASTEQVARRMNQTNGDTASQLSVLRAKGLVMQVSHAKGVSGGSTWEVSPDAERLLKDGTE